MNLPTLIALLIIVVLLILAISYLKKNGTCGGCPDAPSCNGHCHRDMLAELEKDPDYQTKNKSIDEIMKKHGMNS